MPQRVRDRGSGGVTRVSASEVANGTRRICGDSAWRPRQRVRDRQRDQAMQHVSSAL